MADRSKKVLLTGISGFTGRHLEAVLLARGHEVCGISRSDPRFILADLGDHVQTSAILRAERPTHIVHLSGISFPAHGVASELYDVNLRHTVNLLEASACIADRLEQIVLVSTAAVYGASDRTQVAPITEEHDLQPASHYSLSKYFAEKAAQLFCDLPILTVRPFNYLGPEQEDVFFVPKIVNACLRGDDTLKVGNLDIVRDFSDVRDVAEAYARLIDANISNRNINICSGKGVHLKDIVKFIENLSGKKINLSQDPSLIRPNEPQVIIGSNKALIDLVGEYQRYNINDTLEWIWNLKKYK